MITDMHEVEVCCMDELVLKAEAAWMCLQSPFCCYQHSVIWVVVWQQQQQLVVAATNG